MAPKSSSRDGSCDGVDHGRRLWDKTAAQYNLDDIGLEFLAEACAARDRAESLRAQIDREGEKLPDGRATRF
jgi:hypothetical protein